LARAIREEFGLDVYVPRWKETLTLKPKEVILGVAPEEIVAKDKSQNMLDTIMDLER